MNILFEAQLGSLRDLDYGIHPYTTSSNTTAAYAPVGSGCPSATLNKVIGVVKAYSTCVGEGPFVTELFGKEADLLRENGSEYGAKTGRPRRVGPLDLVATKYGVEVQGATDLALTKMDILSYLDEIPVCVAYKHKNETITRFPFPSVLKECEPVYIKMKGWKKDLSKCRSYEELPYEAQQYIEFIEKEVGAHISYVSVGAEREAIIYR